MLLKSNKVLKVILSTIVILSSIILNAQIITNSHAALTLCEEIKNSGGEFCDILPVQIDTINIDNLSERGKAFLFGMVVMDITYLNVYDKTIDLIGAMAFLNNLISSSAVAAMYDEFLTEKVIKKLEESSSNPNPVFAEMLQNFSDTLIKEGYEKQLINVIQGVILSQKKYLNYYLLKLDDKTALEAMNEDLNKQNEARFRYLTKKLKDKKGLKENKVFIKKVNREESFTRIIEFQNEMIFE